MRGFMTCIAHQVLGRLPRSWVIRRARHAARMGKKEVHTGYWWGNLKNVDYLDDIGVEVRTSKWI
jgi:hypothetical protein